MFRNGLLGSRDLESTEYMLYDQILSRESYSVLRCTRPTASEQPAILRVPLTVGDQQVAANEFRCSQSNICDFTKALISYNVLKTVLQFNLHNNTKIILW